MSFRARIIKTAPQYGSIALSGVSGTYTLPTTVDKNYSVIEILACWGGTGSNDANVNAARVELTSGTTVTAYLGGYASTVTVWFKVTEYFPWTMRQPVQHKSNTLSFTAVGPNASVYNGGFTSSVTGGTMQNALGGVTQTSSTTVAKVGDAGVVAYCVADWK